MILQMFQVYDSKAKAYLPPFFLASAGLAVRAISECVTDPKHNFCKYSEDFCLYHTGSWDDLDGSIDQFKTPINLGLCTSFKPVVKSELALTNSKEEPDAISNVKPLSSATG